MRPILSLFCLLFFSGVVFALPNDREQLMHVDADSYELNYKTGIDIYEGNVKVDQGTTHLVADRVVTEKNKDRKMISAIAYGHDQLAEFTTIPKEGEEVFHAKAKVIKFYPETSLVQLEENVIVTQGENSFHGPIILYNMKDQIVSTPASANGRATIIINTKQMKS
jgi:lipopolysaccharide export system protein LptA